MSCRVIDGSSSASPAAATRIASSSLRRGRRLLRQDLGDADGVDDAAQPQCTGRPDRGRRAQVVV
jgi:hypothetical protein